MRLLRPDDAGGNGLLLPRCVGSSSVRLGRSFLVAPELVDEKFSGRWLEFGACEGNRASASSDDDDDEGERRTVARDLDLLVGVEGVLDVTAKERVSGSRKNERTRASSPSPGKRQASDLDPLELERLPPSSTMLLLLWHLDSANPKSISKSALLDDPQRKKRTPRPSSPTAHSSPPPSATYPSSKPHPHPAPD